MWCGCVWSSFQHHQQQHHQQLQLKQFEDTEQHKPTDTNSAHAEDKPEIVYAKIVKQPEVVYVNLPDQNGAVASSSGPNDDDPVVYSELHACDLSDLYAKVSRNR